MHQSARRPSALRASGSTWAWRRIVERVRRRDRVCQWRDADCSGRLEVDHIVPRGPGGVGGSDDMANLRLLCAWHHKARHNGMTGPNTKRPPSAKPPSGSLVITKDYTRRRTP